MKHIDICNNPNCRYNKNGRCTLDRFIKNLKPDHPRSIVSLNTVILNDLKKNGSCPRFMD